jgi:hypothetical protein
VKRLAVLVLPIIALSCGGTSASDRDALDGAVKALQPTQIGRVVADSRSGSSSGLDDRPARSIVIVGASSSRLHARMASRLHTAGFDRTGRTGWERRKDDTFVKAFVLPADRAHPPVIDGRRVALGDARAAIVLRLVVS